MQLKTLNEIKNLSEDDFLDYKLNLINSLSSDYPWNPESSVPKILDTIYKYPIEVVTNSLVINYVISYLVENINNINVSYITEKHLFSDNYHIVKWVLNEEEHYVIMDYASSDTLCNDIHTILYEGAFPDNFQTRAELEIELSQEPNTDILLDYLKYLGILNEDEITTIIPVPSPTLDINGATERFSSAVWFKEIQSKTIILAGLGGIGSYVAFMLSRMSPSMLYMYDDDIVEEVNMAGQLYGYQDIGRRKVDSMSNRLSRMSRYFGSFCIPEKYTEESQAHDIMICGFDNMRARKVFFDNWVEHVESKPEEERKNCLFIDGRLAAEEFQVFSIRGDDTLNIIKYSKEYLFLDEEADETLCSYKQTTYMANMIGSVIVNLFTNFVANSIVDNIRELPFLTTYDGSVMTFKTLD